MVATDALKVVGSFKPTNVWELFGELCTIPRPSYHETKAVEWLKDFAKKYSLDFSQDSFGNVCISKTKGVRGDPVIVQNHIDMVTEKNNNITHDFHKDPLSLEIKPEGWVTAKGTTLGADNGLGVCMALAVLADKNAVTPPMQCIFTVQEEVGLNGAKNLDAKALGLTGKTMINLDTEEWGTIYVGCAGGVRSEAKMPFTTEAVTAGHKLLVVQLSGFMGGHSGVNIHEDRANPLVLAARCAQQLLTVDKLQIVNFKGGDKFNALCREAEVLVAYPPSSQAAVDKIMTQQEDLMKKEYARKEKEGKLVGVTVKASIFKDTKNDQAMTQTSAKQLTGLLNVIPHGPLKYSHSIANLVETSTNLASVRIEGTEIRIESSTRSSIDESLKNIELKLEILYSQFGAVIQHLDGYPGWAPNPDSPVLKLTKALYEKTFKVVPEVTAIHAGLECGILMEKLPGTDVVSFGPTIHGAHSPDEQAEIETVDHCFKLFSSLLAELSGVEQGKFPTLPTIG